MGAAAGRGKEEENDSSAKDPDAIKFWFGEQPIPDPSSLAYDMQKMLVSKQSHQLASDNMSRMLLYIKLCALAKQDQFVCVIYTKVGQHPEWKQLTMTDYNEELTDIVTFTKDMEFRYCFEKSRLLRFEVYKVRDPVFIDDLRYQKYVGNAQVSVGEMMRGRNKLTGWLVKDLVHPVKGSVNNNGVPLGKIALWLEEDPNLKQEVSFNMSGVKVPSGDLWKMSPDAYCIFKRVIPGEAGSRMRTLDLWRTEVARHSRTPKFKRLVFPVPQLWPYDIKQDVIIELRDFIRVSTDKVIGDAHLSYGDLMQAFKDSRPMVTPVYHAKGKRVHEDKNRRKRQRTTRYANYNQVIGDRSTRQLMEEENKKLMCGIQMEMVGVERRYSFFDFVRGGLGLRFMCCIDFTCSSGDVQDKNSLHYRAPDTQALNAYENVVKAVGDVLGHYDHDDRFLAYGFGAKVPPSRTCAPGAFALSGDFFDPEIVGVDRITEAYRKALKIVKLHGPTSLTPIVRLAVDLASGYKDARTVNDNGVDMDFFVQCIITDGHVDEGDKRTLVEVLLEAVEVPLCVIIIGIGDTEPFLKDLHLEVREARRTLEDALDEELEASRKVVHYARFGAFMSTHEELEALAETALMAVPEEVTGYYKYKGVKPRGLNVYEDEGGRPVPRPDNPVGPPPKGNKDTVKIAAAAAAKRKATRSETNRSENSNELTREQLAKKAREAAAIARAADRIPKHVKERRAALHKQAIALGYGKMQVERALKQGCPSDDIEMLVDTIISCGSAKAHMPYKEQAEAATSHHVESQISSLLNEATAQLMLAETTDLLNCDRVSLFVFEETNNKLRLYAANLNIVISVSPGQGLVGHVFREGYNVNIPDCYKDYRFDRFFDAKTGYLTRSILAVPVFGPDGSACGVIQAINKLPLGCPKLIENRHLRAVPFNNVDMETVVMLAKSIGSGLQQGTLDNSGIVTSLARAKKMRELESDVARKMPQEDIEFLMNKLLWLLHCDRVSFFVYDYTSETLILYSSNMEQPIHVPPGKGIAGAVFRDQDMVNIPDCYQDPRFDNRFDIRSGYCTRSMMVAPVVQGDRDWEEHLESVGVIQVLNKLTQTVDMDDPERYLHAVPFSKDDERVLANVARQVGIGIKKGRVDVDKIASYMEMAAKKRRTMIVPTTTVTAPETPPEMPALPGSVEEPPAEEFGYEKCRLCLSKDIDRENRPCGCRLFCADCQPASMAPCPSCGMKIASCEYLDPILRNKAKGPPRPLTPLTASTARPGSSSDAVRRAATAKVVNADGENPLMTMMMSGESWFGSTRSSMASQGGREGSPGPRGRRMSMRKTM
eukprot:TRINITY_DN92204_c0_g1_i1.p1 TRINITY_DN92204_c0_g1~~TRINITY_DN92204_c0_g1_i1.p1  ORF type:complete len:1332 (+),score=372.34 TRINITY_DN92204_c0_g1_i1:198-4193(+)